MRDQDFAPNAPGTLVSIGNDLGKGYLPNALPPEGAFGGECQPFHERALLALGELRAIIPSLPNPSLVTTPFLRREAVLSSRIEGTRTEVEQLYLFEASEPPSSRNESDEIQDAREVLNYVRALLYGLDSLKSRTNCHQVIKEMHNLLMKGVRGRDKSPGKYREVQNFIGSGRLGGARFVPPPWIHVQQVMDDLEAYIISPKDSYPSLVRIAFIHYQFETIHPFEDGNGRIGRLLISLLLAKYGLLSEPLLYISAYFEQHRDEYNDCMLRISQRGAWDDWIKFFLRAIETVSLDACRRARKLFALREDWRQKLQIVSGSSNLLALVDALFEMPVTTIPQVRDKLQLTYNGAQKNVDRLEQAGFLVEVTGQKRNRRYVAKPITDIVAADEA